MPLSRSKCNPFKFLRSKTKQKKIDTVIDKLPASTDRALTPDLEKDIAQQPNAEEHRDLLATAYQQLLQDKQIEPILKKAALILEASGLDLGTNGVADLQQLHKSLNTKVDELKQKEWEISIDDHHIKVKDQLYGVINNVLVLKDIINTAASACAPAAIVCAGVTVSLLFIIRAHEQQESLLGGLEMTSNLIPRLYLRERHYMNTDTNLPETFVSRFKAGLVALYSKILEFQARALCFLGENSFIQFSSNVLNRNQWDVLTKSITEQEIEAQKFTTLIDAEERTADKDMILGDLEARFLKLEQGQASLDRRKQVKKLLESLHTCPYRDRKNRVSNRVLGTCEWFTSHHLFQTWDENDDSHLLWLSADPGCGKSVLSKYLVDEVLQRPQKRTVCYFFFRDDFPDQRKLSIALASILRQLFIAQPHLLSDNMLHRFATEGSKLLESFDGLWEIFVSVTASGGCGEIICVMDALDECAEEDRNQLIGAVRDLFFKSKNSTSGLKFFLTSRPYGSIHARFRQLEDRVPTIHLKGDADVEIEKISQEITLVIEHRAREIAIQKLLLQDEEEFLREKLTEAKNRTYLWVALTLDYIESLDGFTKGKVRETIRDKIPNTVNEAYEKILNKSKDSAKAKRLLHIIMAAKRPLSVEELSLAVAVDKKIKSSESLMENVEPPQRFRSTLRDMCGLMLVVVDNKVYPLHQTVKEFLVPNAFGVVTSNSRDSEFSSEWSNSLAPAQSNKVLAETLTWYLDSTFTEAGLDILLDYSAYFWDHHFRDAFPDDQSEMSTMGCRICAPDSVLQSKRHNMGRTGTSPDNSDTLITASIFGLPSVVGQILRNESIEVDVKDSRGLRTPLGWAVYHGHDAVVKLLLETNKVDPDSKDNNGVAPLSWAAYNEHDAIVKLLLDTNKVEPDSKGIDGLTPLGWATYHGNDAIVKLLLDTNKVDPDSKSIAGLTLLGLATYHGHDTIVKMLLDTNKVDPDSKANNGLTPLSLAAFYGHDAIMKLLLDTNKVDPVSECMEGLTPLGWAASHGHDAVVKLLLDSRRIDIEAHVSDSGLTPYEVAKKEGHLSTMSIIEGYMKAGKTYTGELE